MKELRITDTNSANDSRGRAFGLEGNDFIYVLIAFVVSLALYLVFAFALRTGLTVALVFSLPVFLGVSGWVLFFRHNRPDGFAEDWFDDLVNDEGWSFTTGAQHVRSAKDYHA